MDIYTLDALLRRDSLIEGYKSFIWTERYNSHGDFELVLRAELNLHRLLRLGTKIVIPDSTRVMIVERLEDEKDDEGHEFIRISGRSLEALLYDRVAQHSYPVPDLEADPSHDYNATPDNVAKSVVKNLCVDGDVDANDVIPFLRVANVADRMYPESNIPLPSDPSIWEVKPGVLYDLVKDLCESYDLGFRITRDGDTSKLYFDVYPGNDLTTLQSDFPPVIIARDFETLKDATVLNSSVGAKNVAYVFGKNIWRKVFPADVDPSVEGFERRILFVDASDVEGSSTTEEDLLEQKGLEELQKSRSLMAMDGQINEYSNSRYGKDYELGDILEVRNPDGVTNQMRVTEQIFVSDEEGDRSYPTLSTNQFITPGSWLAWDYNQVWQDMGPTEYWSTAP